MISELPDDAQRWIAAERELASQVLDRRTMVVNVRRGGPHRHAAGPAVRVTTPGTVDGAPGSLRRCLPAR